MAEVKRFPLSFVNAAEDIPRLIRAYGKCCQGECALVLRPQEDRGLLVHHDKQGGARFWNEAISAGLEAPSNAITVAESVALVKTYQKALPKAGPISLRGSWKGYLYCEDGAPRVELSRKLAAYGTLVITSRSGQGWQWQVVRAEKWFSKPGDQQGQAPSLSAAIERGLASAMGLLGEACSLRDSHRRAAFDTGYAEAHPIKPAREGKDPTERFQPREPKPKAAKEPRAPKTPKAPEVPEPSKDPKQPRLRTGAVAQATPANTAQPSAVPGAKKPRAARTQSTPPAPATASAVDVDIDPEKDRLLLDAFSKAVAAALGNADGPSTEALRAPKVRPANTTTRSRSR